MFSTYDKLKYCTVDPYMHQNPSSQIPDQFVAEISGQNLPAGHKMHSLTDEAMRKLKVPAGHGTGDELLAPQ
eukprot:335846-Hanusia_phi.AAC.1